MRMESKEKGGKQAPVDGGYRRCWEGNECR